MKVAGNGSYIRPIFRSGWPHRIGMPTAFKQTELAELHRQIAAHWRELATCMAAD
ncbi:hypothetical protein D3C80_1857270 [compost metagenome]